MKKMGRYFKLLGIFAKYSLMSALEYRVNFVTGVTVEMGWMVIKLLYVAIVYKAGINIGILTPDHILLFVGTYMLMTGVFMTQAKKSIHPIWKAIPTPIRPHPNRPLMMFTGNWAV